MAGLVFIFGIKNPHLVRRSPRGVWGTNKIIIAFIFRTIRDTISSVNPVTASTCDRQSRIIPRLYARKRGSGSYQKLRLNGSKK